MPTQIMFDVTPLQQLLQAAGVPASIQAEETAEGREIIHLLFNLQGLDIAVRATVPDEAAPLVFQADFDNLGLVGLQSLTALAGGTDLAGQLPADFPVLNELTFQGLELVYDQEAEAVTSLAFQVGASVLWTIIPERLTVGNLGLHWRMDWPFTADKRAQQFTIQGETTLGGTTLLTQAAFPGFLLTAALAPEASLSLRQLAQEMLPADLQLPAGTPDVQLTTLVLQADARQHWLDIQAASEQHWPITAEYALEGVGLQLRLEEKEAGGVAVSGGVTGRSSLFGSTVEVTAAFDEQASLSGRLERLSLRELLRRTMDGVTLPAEVPDFVIQNIELTVVPATKEFSLAGQATADWELPIGIDSLVVGELSVEINRAKTGNKLQTSGALGGSLSLGGGTLALRYAFPGEFVLTSAVPDVNLSGIIQDLCGVDAIAGLPIPLSVLQTPFHGVEVSIAPGDKAFFLTGETPFGQAELRVSKGSTGKWGFIVGFAPPEQFRFSTLDQSLDVLDGLKFSDSAFIISASRDTSAELQIIKVPGGGLNLEPGLTFLAKLDTTGLGVDELMNLKSLAVSATIPTNPALLVIEALIEGSFTIAENVSFGDMRFRIQPAPSNFALGIRGAIMAKLDDSPLVFIGGMEIRPLERTAAFQAMMKGTWNEPFGFKGIAIGNVAADIGLTIVPPPSPPLPVIGLAGSLQVGEFAGSAAVRFDSAMPSKSMLAVAFNKLYLRDIIRTFCEESVYLQIPAELRNTVLTAGMEDVDVYIVPQPTRIVDLVYDQGITLKGKISIADFDARAHINLDYTKGLLVEAEMDTIEIAGVFKISGAKDKPDPLLYLNLRVGEKPGLEIAGSVFLLGLQAETRVSISDQGFAFWVSGKIFDLFEASLEARGADIDQGGNFYIKAVMKNDLFAYLREETTKAIQESSADAVRKLTAAQGELSRAQQEVLKINNNIEAMRAVVRAERERDEANVRKAREAVHDAQNKVNTLDRQINDARAVVQAERKRDADRLAAAQRDVTNAQHAVNGLQSQINSAHAKIRQLNDQIRAKKRWYDNSGWRKSYRWAEYSAYVTAKGSEITALYTKIGTLEASKHTAIGVLEGYKQVLRQIENAAKTFPIDADPRVAGLITARGTANLALIAAQETLRALEKTIKTFPIDADPRLAGLFTARETANLALEAAKLSLEAVKLSIGKLADVGDYIARHGLGGLFDVRAASFEGQLMALNGGRVDMRAKVEFMGEAHDLSFGFSFIDPISGVKMLVEKLVK